MSKKLSIHLVQKALKENEEVRIAKAKKLAYTTNKKGGPVSVPADPSSKKTTVKKIEVKDKGAPMSRSQTKSIPTATRADKIVNTQKASMKTGSDKKDKVASATFKSGPKPDQDTKLKTHKFKAPEDKKDMTKFPSAADPRKTVDAMGHGSKTLNVKSNATPTIKKPKVEQGTATTVATPAKKSASFSDKKSAGKKVDAKFADQSMPSDAPKPVSYDFTPKGENVVESGIAIKVGDKVKAQFGIVKTGVITKLVERYNSFGYDVTFEKTVPAWKKDKKLFKLVRESIDAKENGLVETSDKIRKDAMNRFKTLVESDFNTLYESRREFVDTMSRAFKLIETHMVKKYRAGLELFECTARLVKGDDIITVELMTEATGHPMALRQLQDAVLEEYGFGTEIEHYMVDGKKYSADDVTPWELTEDEDGDDGDDKLDYIAGLVKQGFTSGYNPNWTIEMDRNLDEDALEHIASLIRQGFTSGYQPDWSIKF